jgi:hypothetical protein
MFIFVVGVYVLGFFEDMGAWVRDGPLNFRGANTKKKKSLVLVHNCFLDYHSPRKRGPSWLESMA